MNSEQRVLLIDKIEKALIRNIRKKKRKSLETEKY